MSGRLDGGSHGLASGGTDHGFTYSNGSVTDFSDLPRAPPAETDIGIVAGINDSGEVAGYYYTIPGITFIDDEGFVDNNGSYVYFSISTGQTGGIGTAINNAGEVIGNYHGTFAAGSAIPMPAAWVPLSPPSMAPARWPGIITTAAVPNTASLTSTALSAISAIPMPAAWAPMSPAFLTAAKSLGIITTLAAR